MNKSTLIAPDAETLLPDSFGAGYSSLREENEEGKPARLWLEAGGWGLEAPDSYSPPMDSRRWEIATEYVGTVFGNEDQMLLDLKRSAIDEGIPDWAVTSDLGRLLLVLAKTTPGRRPRDRDPRRVLDDLDREGMQPDGAVTTIEMDDQHADFAERQFARAGLAERITVLRGPALDVLPEFIRENPPGSIDLVFIDADKESYSEYYRLTRNLVSPGGLLLVDNILGTGSTWIGDGSRQSAATDEMNRMAAADPDFDVAGVFVRQGLLVARRRGVASYQLPASSHQLPATAKTEAQKTPLSSVSAVRSPLQARWATAHPSRTSYRVFRIRCQIVPPRRGSTMK